MQMIVAYIRPRMQDGVVEVLRRMKVLGASFSSIDGFGLETDREGKASYDETVSPYAHKIKLEVVCTDERGADLVDAIARAAQTGRRGDGKVYVLPVAQAVDIRTYDGSAKAR